MTHLNTKQKLSLLALYAGEIKKRLTPIYFNNESIGLLRELLDLNKFEEISLYSNGEVEFTENLWNLLMSSPMVAALYDTILNYLYPVDLDLHSTLCCVSDNDSRSQFRLVLSNLEGFWSYLDVKSTINFFMQLDCYSVVISRLERTLEAIEDESTKKKLILRTIPLLGTDATYDLMRSIYDNSEDAALFVNSLHPNFLRFYALVNKERDSPRGVVSVCPPGVPVEAVLDPSTESKYKINLNYEDLPFFLGHCDNVMSRLLKSIDLREFEETPILLRDYQKELCESSLSGINTIIAAPTGSGKTVVATHIIKNHLEKSKHDGRKKVLFMTPNTVILDQQAACLRKFLGHRYEVFAVRGSDNAPLREFIMTKDVIVSTPQLIVNLLTYGDSSDIDMVQTSFDVTTFTMIVFDECHNAVKNSPYAVFMRICHRLKFSRRIKSGCSLPQILGLTASFGVGGASTEKDAITHIVKLCAILNCSVISTVRKNTDELRRYSSDVCDEIRFCNDHCSGCRPLFLERLCVLMTLFEESLYAIYNKCATKVPRISVCGEHITDQPENFYVYERFTRAPEDKTSQPYLNWVSTHLRRIVPETNFAEEVSKTEAIELLEIIHDLYRAIELYQDFSSVESFKYLKEQMTLREASLTESSRRIWAEYHGELEGLQTSDNVLITELVQQLCSYKNTDFRAIVFVRTRRGASILSEILNSHPHLVADNLRVECVTGFNKNCPETTKRSQIDKLKRFREGVTRVLVSTSVADEGLDVVKCNIVIKYNYATNEIAHVQRKGRGRAKNSKSILITQNIKLKEQEEKNISKERLMNSVLHDIQEKKIDLQSRVEKAIEELHMDIQMEEALNAQRIATQKSSGVSYELLCSKCDAFLCKSKDIKTYKNSQYCVCDPSFWSKTCNEKLSADNKEAKYGAVAKLYCGRPHCRNTLGRVLSVANGSMPALSASAFVLRSFDPTTPVRRTVRKWSSVAKSYFTPDHVRNHDILAMSQAMERPITKSDTTLPPC